MNHEFDLTIEWYNDRQSALFGTRIVFSKEFYFFASTYTYINII